MAVTRAPTPLEPGEEPSTSAVLTEGVASAKGARQGKGTVPHRFESHPARNIRGGPGPERRRRQAAAFASPEPELEQRWLVAQHREHSRSSMASASHRHGRPLPPPLSATCLRIRPAYIATWQQRKGLPLTHGTSHRDGRNADSKPTLANQSWPHSALSTFSVNNLAVSGQGIRAPLHIPVVAEPARPRALNLLVGHCSHGDTYIGGKME